MYKKYFPVLNTQKDGKDLIYFDAACSYLKNEKTLEGIIKYYTEYSCCSGDRESSLLGSQLLEEINDARKRVKDFIGAKPQDTIIFTSGTTDSINKLIFSLDEEITTIITSDLEHNSNYLPQLEYSKCKNIDLKIFPYLDMLDVKVLDTKLSKIRGKFLFCCTQSSNIIGGKFDIESIAKVVHKHGGYILVDDAQYISYNKEDVGGKDIDFLAFSAHKIGGPTGIGVLYIKSESKDVLKYSNKVGGGTVKTISDFVPDYKKSADFFEGGVQDFAGSLGLKYCIDFIEKITIEKIHAHIVNLSEYFWKNFERDNMQEVFTPMSHKKSAIITLVPNDFHATDFHSYCNYFLETSIISFRTGSVCADNYVNTYLDGNKNIIRLSFGIYNTTEEIDIFFDALKKFLKESEQ